MTTRALGVIPARYGSTRFPGKALATLQGRPLIQHVYERARQAKSLEQVIVATDDERIAQAVRAFGGQAAMTSAAHRSGSDRCAEVARESRSPVVINIQGDEPLIHPGQIDQLAEFLLAHEAVPMATAMIALEQAEQIDSPHVVKVVVDQDGYALYFSRRAIPFVREGQTGVRHFKHVGLYGYQRDFLLRLAHLPLTPLEQAEQLEQLRVLEHGYKIKVLETMHDTIGVDTPADLAKVEALLAPEARAIR